MSARIFKNLSDTTYTELKAVIPDPQAYQLALGIAALVDAYYLPIGLEKYDPDTRELKLAHADPRFAALDQLNQLADTTKLDPEIYDLFKYTADIINSVFRTNIAQRDFPDLSSITVSAGTISMDAISQSAGRIRDIVTQNQGMRQVMADLKNDISSASKNIDYRSTLLVARTDPGIRAVDIAVKNYCDLCEVAKATSHPDIIMSFPLLPLERKPEMEKRFPKRLHKAGSLFEKHEEALRAHVTNPDTLTSLKSLFAVDSITSRVLNTVTPESLARGLAHWKEVCCQIFHESSEKLLAAQAKAKHPVRHL